jgi:2-oxoglutarate dehydrogenase E1 component
MTPKSLLRNKAAVSPVGEFVQGHFHDVLDDVSADAARVRRVLLCSGKVFYDLAKLRQETGSDDIAIVRVEQFYPLNEELLRNVLRRYRKAKEWAWVQEESQNNGGWFFMEPRLRALGYAVEYVGRDASASPATGSWKVHEREQQELVDAAIRGGVPHIVRAAGFNAKPARVAETATVPARDGRTPAPAAK